MIFTVFYSGRKLGDKFFMIYFRQRSREGKGVYNFMIMTGFYSVLLT